MKGGIGALLFALLLLVGHSELFSGEPTMEWTASSKSVSSGVVSVLAFTCRPNTNVYLAVSAQTYSGPDCIKTSKYDKNGKLAWTTDHPAGPFLLDVHAIAAEDAGNVFITGNKYNNSDNSKWGMFTVKYDDQGKELWAKEIPHMSSSVLLISQGYLYAGGGFFDKQNGYALIKYDSDGNEVSLHKVSPKRRYFAAETIFEKDGFIYIQGPAGTAKYTKETDLVWFKEAGWLLDRSGADRLFYVKRPKKNMFRIECKDEKGKLLWDAPLGDTKAEDIEAPPLMACDSQGNLYAGTTIYPKESMSEILLAKYTRNGAKQWESRHSHTSSSRDILKALKVDDAGAVYLLDYEASSANDLFFGLRSYFSMAKFTTNGGKCWSVGLQGSPKVMTVDGRDIYVVNSGDDSNEHYCLIKYVQPSDEPAEDKAQVQNPPVFVEQTEKETMSEPVSLTEEERAYASRMRVNFNSVLTHLGSGISKEDIIIPDMIYETELYRKWGLGPKRDFSLQELYYIMNLQQVESNWQMYSSIDLKNLTDAEKDNLQRTRLKYGDGPINLRQKAFDEHQSLDAHQQLFFDLIKAVTGTDTLDERGLVFAYRITPK